MAQSLADRLRALARRLEREALSTRQRSSLEALLAEMEGRLGEGGAADRDEPDAPAGEGDAGTIRIWCDGSCAPNPGPGGWGAIIERDGRREEISGAARRSTNNVMELTAAMEALKRTPEGATVELTTDSRYLADGITRWLAGWKRKGWRKADGGTVLNRALWRALDGLSSSRRVTWLWVPAHSGHPENERCDVLANEARRNQ